MSAPKGNRFWEARSSAGANPTFESPEQLWKMCTEYFEWVEANPLWENKATQYQGLPVDIPVAKMRAMTIHGLCLFLGITRQTWINYRNNQAFFEVVTQVDDVLYTQKFSGAAADLLNSNIIARDLGLKESIDHSGEIDINKMSDEELNAALAIAINEYASINKTAED